MGNIWKVIIANATCPRYPHVDQEVSVQAMKDIDTIIHAVKDAERVFGILVESYGANEIGLRWGRQLGEAAKLLEKEDSNELQVPLSNQ